MQIQSDKEYFLGNKKYTGLQLNQMFGGTAQELYNSGNIMLEPVDKTPDEITEIEEHFKTMMKIRETIGITEFTAAYAKMFGYTRSMKEFDLWNDKLLRHIPKIVNHVYIVEIHNSGIPEWYEVYKEVGVFLDQFSAEAYARTIKLENCRMVDTSPNSVTMQRKYEDHVFYLGDNRKFRDEDEADFAVSVRRVEVMK